MASSVDLETPPKEPLDGAGRIYASANELRRGILNLSPNNAPPVL